MELLKVVHHRFAVLQKENYPVEAVVPVQVTREENSRHDTPDERRNELRSRQRVRFFF